MFGERDIMEVFARQFRVTEDVRTVARSSSFRHERHDVDVYLTVQHLLDWIAGPLAEKWRQYNLVWSNCQHYAEDLRQFLMTGQRKADRELVLAAVKQNKEALLYAEEELRADRDFMLAVVKQNGLALQYTTDALRADRQVVLAAVTQSGWSLKYAAEELKADCNLVLTAVKQ